MGTQRIEVGYDEPTFSKVKTESELEFERIPDDGEINDSIGVYNTASNVHSKSTSMTRDYTLARYNSTIVNDKLPKFLREQRKVLRVIKSYLIVNIITLKKRYNQNMAILIQNELKKIYAEIDNLIIGESDELVIMSRAGKGHVIDSMLKVNLGEKEREEYDKSVGESIPDKLFNKDKE